MKGEFPKEGKIPAWTVCPWSLQCMQNAKGICGHKGIKHPVPFSCGLARGFEIADIPPDLPWSKG